MEWNFTLHTDNSDDGASSWPNPDAKPPSAIWAIGPPPGDDSGTWLVGLRFVIRDGHPTLVAIQMLPDHGIASMLTSNAQPGATAMDPEAELTATVLRTVTLGSMQTQVRAALANYKDPAWGDNHLEAYDDGEPPSNWSEHDELTSATGVNVSDTTQRSKAGRRPLPDELLAEVAFHYAHALRHDLPIRTYIESKMKEGWEGLPVEQWVFKARRRGFLTGTTRQGQRGGVITPEAINTLKRSGFLSRNGTRTGKQEGTTE